MNSTNKEKKWFLQNTVDKEQAKDTGMAMVLICLIVWYFYRSEWVIVLSAVFLMINMIIPQLYNPVAKLWFGFSNLFGAIITNILLTILFLILVTPVGVFRRLIGKDTLLLKKWKKSDASVFCIRNHTYGPEDIDRPY